MTVVCESIPTGVRLVSLFEANIFRYMTIVEL